MLLVDHLGADDEVAGALAHSRRLAEGGDQVGIGVRAGIGVHETIEMTLVVELGPGLVGGDQDLLALRGVGDLERRVDGRHRLALQHALDPILAELALGLEGQELVEAGTDPRSERGRSQADDGRLVLTGQAVQRTNGLVHHVSFLVVDGVDPRNFPQASLPCP